MDKLNPRHIERLELLDGARPGAGDQAAVRVRDLLPLLQIKQLQSRPAAGATPTKAEYDALVKDVHQVEARLREIATVLQKAVAR